MQGSWGRHSVCRSLGCPPVTPNRKQGDKNNPGPFTVFLGGRGVLILQHVVALWHRREAASVSSPTRSGGCPRVPLWEHRWPWGVSVDHEDEPGWGTAPPPHPSPGQPLPHPSPGGTWCRLPGFPRGRHLEPGTAEVLPPRWLVPRLPAPRRAVTVTSASRSSAEMLTKFRSGDSTGVDCGKKVGKMERKQNKTKRVWCQWVCRSCIPWGSS